jgi:transposase
MGWVVGGDGAVIDRFDVAHDAGGLKQMVRRFGAAGVQNVAIERGDGPIVEVLLDASLSVFVVPSRQIKSLRSRYGSAGNKDDRLDAYVLADTLRTDGHRWRPLREDSDETRALRALCRARKDLVEVRVQTLNQLRSNLELALPGSVGLFARPHSKITLAFLTRFPTAEKVAWLSPRRLQAWLTSVGYTGGVAADTLFERLTQAAPGLTGAEGAARGRITLGLVRMVEALNAEIEQIDADISQLFRTHPDQHIFTSLPRSGMVRAASLLAEIGDCRERFPSDDADGTPGVGPGLARVGHLVGAVLSVASRGLVAGRGRRRRQPQRQLVRVVENDCVLGWKIER